MSCAWYINQVDPGGCQFFLEQCLGSLCAHTVHRATSTRATDNSCSECAWRWLRRPFQLSRACLALLYGTKARATSPPRISTVFLGELYLHSWFTGLLPGLLCVCYYVRAINGAQLCLFWAESLCKNLV